LRVGNEMRAANQGSTKTIIADMEAQLTRADMVPSAGEYLRLLEIRSSRDQDRVANIAIGWRRGYPWKLNDP
jgi:hypothetical protein